eukprot:6148446-Pleurochrysis_carterae.AAC.2
MSARAQSSNAHSPPQLRRAQALPVAAYRHGRNEGSGCGNGLVDRHGVRDVSDSCDNRGNSLIPRYSIRNLRGQETCVVSSGHRCRNAPSHGVRAEAASVQDERRAGNDQGRLLRCARAGSRRARHRTTTQNGRSVSSRTFCFAHTLEIVSVSLLQAHILLSSRTIPLLSSRTILHMNLLGR